MLKHEEKSEHEVIPPARVAEVGLVHFEDAAGTWIGDAIYHTPVSLRDRTLTYQFKPHEQNHQNEKGEWVYRQTATSGTGPVEYDALLEVVQPEPEPEPVKAKHAKEK